MSTPAERVADFVAAWREKHGTDWIRGHALNKQNYLDGKDLCSILAENYALKEEINALKNRLAQVDSDYRNKRILAVLRQEPKS